MAVETRKLGKSAGRWKGKSAGRWKGRSAGRRKGRSAGRRRGRSAGRRRAGRLHQSTAERLGTAFQAGSAFKEWAKKTVLGQSLKKSLLLNGKKI
ncbi:MAG: hypothetical protein LBT40_03460 [Deltaproteobacteria bacterium]|jgi:hypothetical protein|nr:hypothetical protein [Deltaproteobacteria bacterium]